MQFAAGRDSIIPLALGRTTLCTGDMFDTMERGEHTHYYSRYGVDLKGTTNPVWCSARASTSRGYRQPGIGQV